MIESATGLVLRTRPLTETSLIVRWLTPTLGRVATVAKGARRPKSAFRGKLDLFYLADFSFSRSRHSDLHTLREVRLQETHSALREDLDSLQQVSYAATLIEQATEMETPLPAIYELMRALLRQVLSKAPPPQTIFAFELKLLAELGLEPNLAECRLTEGAKQIARILGEAAWGASSRLRLSRAQVEELGQFLHDFLLFHLGRIPKARPTAFSRPPTLQPPSPPARTTSRAL
jgi:DNA repair protein RecO